MKVSRKSKLKYSPTRKREATENLSTGLFAEHPKFGAQRHVQRAGWAGLRGRHETISLRLKR